MTCANLIRFLMVPKNNLHVCNYSKWPMRRRLERKWSCIFIMDCGTLKKRNVFAVGYTFLLLNWMSISFIPHATEN